MLNFFKKMDFWSGMILLGVVLSTGLGIWYLQQSKKLEQCKSAFRAADKWLPVIHSTLTDLEGLIKAKIDNAGEIDNVDPGSYLESQFVNAGIPGRDFTVSGGDRHPTVSLRIGSKIVRATETEITLNFKKSADKKSKAYPRKNIYWAIFNAERKSKRWRLRSLDLRAEQLRSKSRNKEGMPDELNDNWFIDKMVFVSRQPVTSTRKAR